MVLCMALAKTRNGPDRTKIKRGERMYTTEIKLSALKGTRACATTLADSRCK